MVLSAVRYVQMASPPTHSLVNSLTPDEQYFLSVKLVENETSREANFG